MSLLIKALRKGSRQIQKMELRAHQELIVGRSTKKLGLERDPRLSRKHFKLRFTGDEIVVTHLSKTNPTLIAEEGVEEFRPVTGDCSVDVSCRIIAGSYRFQLELMQPVQEESFYQLTEDASDFSPPAINETPIEEPVVSEPVSNIDSGLAEGDWRSSECHLGEVPDFFDEDAAREAQTKVSRNSEAEAPRRGPDTDRIGSGRSEIRRSFEEAPAKKPVEPLRLTPRNKPVELDLEDSNPEVQPPKKSSPDQEKLVFPIDDDFFD